MPLRIENKVDEFAYDRLPERRDIFANELLEIGVREVVRQHSLRLGINILIRQ